MKRAHAVLIIPSNQERKLGYNGSQPGAGIRDKTLRVTGPCEPPWRPFPWLLSATWRKGACTLPVTLSVLCGLPQLPLCERGAHEQHLRGGRSGWEGAGAEFSVVESTGTAAQ
jgi:hypothetical protein